MGQTSVAVGDTSPLFYLHCIGQLDLLPQLFDEVCVPPAVAAELQAGLKDGAPDLKQVPWIKIKTSKTVKFFSSLLPLGVGETEVVALAMSYLASASKQQPPPVVALLDDKPARRFAHAWAVPVKGTLGILLDAKKQGLIPLVRPMVERLRDTTNMYLDDKLLQRICRLAGE